VTAAQTPPRAALSRRFLLLLATPALGLALAITTVTTYLPVLIADVSGPAVTGALIGGEGVLALFVPALVGGWSDTVRTRLGRRLPFVLAGLPLMVVALLVMPLTTALLPLALALLVFYLGYFVVYAPYRAMYPDLVPDEQRGRSQGSQNALREVGLGAALVFGGVLLAVWQGLPFYVSAAVLILITLAFVVRVRPAALRAEDAAHSAVEHTGHWRAFGLLRESGDIRALLAANACWEGALGALKTFAVLFITKGLGYSSALASATLAVVAVGVVAAALVSGGLADRMGHRKLIFWSAWVYGFGLILPIFVHTPVVIVALIPLAFAAGVVMTLPYGLLMGMLPEDDHGAGAGAFEASRGVGVVLGPILAGVAVQVLPGFESTDGYGAMFAVAAAMLFVSIPLTRRIRTPRAAT
jgi:Na+/melibiose symporter-like transporter